MAGIYANSNYDPVKQDDEGPRQKIVQQIEENYDQIKRAIMNGSERKIEEQVEADNPFFKAGKRALAAMHDNIDFPTVPENA